MSFLKPRSPIVRVKIAQAIQWRDKAPLGARELFKLPDPHPTWWRMISKAARSGTPFYNVVLDITFATIEDPAVPDFPAWLEEWDEDLPAIRRDEALALLFKFLKAERGAPVPGVSMYHLHWLALSAYYCPRRDPFTALNELVASGRLGDTDAGSLYHDLRWPLIINDTTVDELRRARLEAQLPTFTKAEWWLDSLAKAFPRMFGIGRHIVRSQGLDA